MLYYPLHYNNYNILLIYLDGDSSDCSNHVIQPKPTRNNSRYTGAFWPNDSYFPSDQPPTEIKRIMFKFNVVNDLPVHDDTPVFTINIFDSANMTMAEAMYKEAENDTYFQGSPLVTSIFRNNRYFLGRNIVSNYDYMLVIQMFIILLTIVTEWYL